MLRRCLGSQTCAAAPWLLLRLEASAKSGALHHLWSIDGDTYSRGRLSALGRRLDVVHWAADLAAGHRGPQHHVGKCDPVWPALSGAVPPDVVAVSCLPSHICCLSTWAAPVLARELSLLPSQAFHGSTRRSSLPWMAKMPPCMWPRTPPEWGAAILWAPHNICTTNWVCSARLRRRRPVCWHSSAPQTLA